MKNNKISIIIPVYNALDDLKLCIESLLENVDFSNTSVVAIDDCSGIETVQYLSMIKNNYGDKIEVITNEENLGFVKTCNKGLAYKEAEIYVLLNSDTIISKGFCEKIIQCFDSDDKIGIASPIASHSSRYYFFKPVDITLEQVNEKLVKVHQKTYPKVASAEGFCFCIRNNVYKTTGGLDVIYGKGYYEEIDYSFKAIEKGFDCVLIDDLYVYHKNNVSFGSKKRKEYMKKNSIIFNERWKDFRKNWELQNNHINPIKKIRKEFYKGKFITKCEKAYIVNVFGKLLKFKIKTIT